MTVNFDMPLDGPVVDSETTSAVPSLSPQPTSESVSALISEPLAGGIVPVVPFLSGEHPDWELWNMEAIMDLETVWLHSIGGEVVNTTLRDIYPAIVHEIKFVYPAMYKVLEDSMRTNGQQVPVRVFQDKTKIRDGIHRIVIADLIGWPCMLVSTESSFWTEWDNTQPGLEYDRLKKERFGIR